MNIFKDFAEFITLLQKHKVDYLIVGGYAVGVHSRPKVTQDIDFWIKPSVENAENVIKVLNEFGFSDIDLSVDDLIDKNQVIMFGNPPFRIDILTSISGVEFDEAFEGKFVHDLGHVKNVNFISLDFLLKNKKASNRPKDKEDLRWIENYGKSN